MMIIEKAHTEYCLYRIPGLVATQQNTLLGYYECRNTESDWAQIDLKVIRSTDGGEHWNTVFFFPGEGDTLSNPVMVVNGQTIHFLFCRNYNKLYHCKSTDDGLTFSEPVEITDVFDNCGFFHNVFAIGPGHGIVHKGHLLIPIWFAQNKDDPWAHHPSIIGTIYSADGEHWQLGELLDIKTLVDPSECALAVTKDNQVLVSIRNESPEHCRAFAVSDTGFSGWTVPYFTAQMADPICQGSMTHKDGVLYHINCDVPTGHDRVNLTIKVSEDSFQTYQSILVDPVAGYSDIALLGNELCVLYEQDCNCALCFQKIPC